LQRGESLFYHQPDLQQCNRERKRFCKCVGKNNIECKEVTHKQKRWVNPGEVELQPDGTLLTFIFNGNTSQVFYFANWKVFIF